MTTEEALEASGAEPVNDIFQINPDSTNPYAKGDKVTHNGKTWISTADGNVWEPGVYGWEEV
ncbi:carbohydrate-binding protein [Dorea longicatena]|mgnify:CR=1 FL=1|uniref:carbohydrate-binding protein n=1 Tax=Dorea longicatena TaxID=88431 RepID=UPI0022E0A881|nr:carbohydrate-binding protein [Dorea longicatena]